MVLNKNFTRLLLLWVIYALGLLRSCSGQDECVPKDFGQGSVVCVCNATYCDDIGQIDRPPVGQYLVYTSTQDGLRFQKYQGPITPSELNGDVTITIDRSQRLQTILGFGGAFTDAAAINIANLSSETQDRLLRTYFSDEGLEYTLGRVPIGGSDFSKRGYTYDDDHDGDFNLTYFALASEDVDYKIPLILRVQRAYGRPIKMFASAWSAPAWMKTNDNLKGKGTLLGEPGGQYYQTWANYYVRFLQEYEKRNVTFWGVTSQNEPVDGDTPGFSFNCMGFTADTLGTFIGTNLGPTLEEAGYGDVTLMMFDDQRPLLYDWTTKILANDSLASHYVKGIALHWYWNFLVGPEVMVRTHDAFPELFILATEACEGASPEPNHVILGSWRRAENYAQDILQDLSNWVVGWTDWNLAVDQEGGPNWTGNFVDSPIIVDADNDQFYKQPMFYALGHVSKFLPPGSVVLNSTTTDRPIYHVVAETEDQSTVLVLLNRSDNSTTITIDDPTYGAFDVDVPAHSIQSYTWVLE